jgi:L-lactate dehydrogenase complex protein LldG
VCDDAVSGESRIKVIESDLGERIQQLDGQSPSQIVFPAIHKTRQDVAQLFARTIGTDPNNDDPHFLTEAMRNKARPRFLAAGAGMTGGNFAIAETGTFVVCTNEGNVPKQPVERPVIPGFRWTAGSLKAAFEQHLQEAGGAAHDVGSTAEANAKVITLHPQAKVVCSAVPEITGTRRVEKVQDPHELADVDVGIVRAEVGIAESGAVWVTQEDLVVTALAFLSQHLVVLLDPEQIVPYMHEAYARVQLDKTAYGCFMMGPLGDRGC